MSKIKFKCPDGSIHLEKARCVAYFDEVENLIGDLGEHDGEHIKIEFPFCVKELIDPYYIFHKNSAACSCAYEDTCFCGGYLLEGARYQLR